MYAAGRLRYRPNAWSVDGWNIAVVCGSMAGRIGDCRV